MCATFRLLRPFLRSRCRQLSVLPRFHNATGIPQKRQSRQTKQNQVVSFENGIYEEQLDELVGASKEAYPRILASESGVSCRDFVKKYELIQRGATLDSEFITIGGMFVWSRPPTLAYASRKDKVISYCGLKIGLY